VIFFEEKMSNKNTGFQAWKARLDYMSSEFPFSSKEEGIIEIRNEDGNLHADNQPARRTPTKITWYQNGRKHGIDADIFGTIFYYYENIRIPLKYHQAINNPDILTIKEVFSNENAELRYVGMKIVGFEKVMKHKNTKIIHTDKKNNQVLFSISGIFEDPISYVKVVNSTAEPDGSYKNYYLCVPPVTQGIKTCAAAVAWTFRMTEKEYCPSQET
jgi:hypothetical protein